mmetsp:Transcript_10109/g.16290  ORF Transcript_10109/g.16290 Transcript_10109/m.16290 type:complete len:207 (+) Transcript_10109:282-902(+)
MDPVWSFGISWMTSPESPSYKNIFPSEPTLTARSPAGLKATALTKLVCGWFVCSSLAGSPPCQITLPSSAAVTTRAAALSGAPGRKAAAVPRRWCPRPTCPAGFPLATANTRATWPWLSPQAARCRPSGDQSRSRTSPCTTNTSFFKLCSWLSNAQIRTLPLASPDATQHPSGENFATVVNALCPRYTRSLAAFSMSRTTMNLPLG